MVLSQWTGLRGMLKTLLPGTGAQPAVAMADDAEMPIPGWIPVFYPFLRDTHITTDL